MKKKYIWRQKEEKGKKSPERLSFFFYANVNLPLTKDHKLHDCQTQFTKVAIFAANLANKIPLFRLETKRVAASSPVLRCKSITLLSHAFTARPTKLMSYRWMFLHYDRIKYIWLYAYSTIIKKLADYLHLFINLKLTKIDLWKPPSRLNKAENLKVKWPLIL